MAAWLRKALKARWQSKLINDQFPVACQSWGTIATASAVDSAPGWIFSVFRNWSSSVVVILSSRSGMVSANVARSGITGEAQHGHCVTEAEEFDVESVSSDRRLEVSSGSGVGCRIGVGE